MFFSCDIERDHMCYSFNRYDILLSNICNCTFSQGNLRNGVHQHNCYEVCIVTEGSGYFVCNNSTYVVDQNCIFIVSPNVEHEIICGEGGWLKLWFYTFAVTTNTNKELELTEQDKIVEDFIFQHHSLTENCEYLTSYAEFHHNYSRKGGYYGLRAVSISMLLDCMQLLCALRNQKAVNSDNPLKYNIASFISNNIQSNVGIDDICSHLHLSQRTVYLLFKKYFKTTPSSYINTEKINASIGYLKMGFSIKTVAELMGFTELSSFSRLFKKVTGHSPSSYLLECKAEVELNVGL